MEDGALFMATHDDASINDLNSLFESVSGGENVYEKLSHTNHCDLIVSNIGMYNYANRKLDADDAAAAFQLDEVYHGDSLISAPNIMSALIFHVTCWRNEIQMLLSSNKSAIGSLFVDRLVFLLEQKLAEMV